MSLVDFFFNANYRESLNDKGVKKKELTHDEQRKIDIHALEKHVDDIVESVKNGNRDKNTLSIYSFLRIFERMGYEENDICDAYCRFIEKIENE